MAQYPLMMRSSVCVLLVAVVFIQLSSFNVELVKSELPELFDGSMRSEPSDLSLESSTSSTTSAPSTGKPSTTGEPDEMAEMASPHGTGELSGDNSTTTIRPDEPNNGSRVGVIQNLKSDANKKLYCDKFADPAIFKDCCTMDMDVVIGKKEQNGICFEASHAVQQCCDLKNGKSSVMVKHRFVVIKRIAACFAQIISNVAMSVPKLPDVCCHLPLMDLLPSCKHRVPSTTKMPIISTSMRPTPKKPVSTTTSKKPTARANDGDNDDDDDDDDAKPRLPPRLPHNRPHLKDKVRRKDKATEGEENGDE